MKMSMNVPFCSDIIEEYGGWSGVREDCALLGLDGIEGIWGGEDIPADFPPDLLVGYHLTFYSDWLDFYREDKAALRRKFGSLRAAHDFYGGDPNIIVESFRSDLARARSLGAKYVVFHVSDASLEEAFTYQWQHSDEEIIGEMLGVINTFLADVPPDFEFLVENQWWPGFTFTEPEKTARLLDGINFPQKGIMLDTGHLLNTNLKLRSQAEGLAYIHALLDKHGDLCRHIRGVHLHQGLSGAFVRKHTGFLPEDYPQDYLERWHVAYEQVMQIDRHRPWTNPQVAALLERLQPEYLTHELYAQSRAARRRAVRRQLNTIRKFYSENYL